MSDIGIDKIRLGSQIKTIRLSLGMNQEQFGELFEPIANKSIVSRWEKGQSIPSAERLKIISDVSNTPIEELIYGNLKDTLFSIVKEADSVFEKYNFINYDKIITDFKDHNKVREKQLLFSLGAFKHENYFNTPRPKSLRVEKEKRTPQDIEEINKYYIDEDIKGTELIVKSALNNPKILSLKPQDKSDLIEVLVESAERLFNDETYDNEGTINFVLNRVSDLFESELPNFTTTIVKYGQKEKSVLREDINPELIEDLDKLYSYIDNYMNELDMKYTSN
ncbi:helix-turn-helix domain-containing protein [Vagococcus lutrae]|uniref:helix-turn-helix domain-containing protein n=1 Tax=Vagococcus lutrae TaxID=81947 RepID=UPI0028921198|nr:helix-turn-helix transcriptional regulator [Vagococcus lutrae]MDT2842878.1 helix-turn-helix transcriptional regulator [Vagococcus lutrae]